MKRIALYKYLLGGLLMVFAAACSGSDDDNTLPSPIEDMPKTVRLTITQTGDENGSANARLLDGTRATLNVNNQNDKVLDASWTANDALTYCNLSYPYNQGSLTATESAATSSFSGNVLCKKDDKLAVVYPAKSFTVANYYILQPYSITLSGQDGTLETLATNFHYVYGVATVTAVNETTATATMPKMKSLLTVCKFSFKDKDNNNDITVKELKISFSNGVTYPYVTCSANTYPQLAQVSVLDNENNAIAQDNVHATPVAGSTPLTITLTSASTEVYVAMLPTPTDATQPISFDFTVNDGTNNYSGTAKAHLHEGKYVVATGLKLTKQP
jgi:hypothetical protein